MGVRILIVDDAPGVRSRLRGALSAIVGVRSVTAAGGHDEGQEMLSREAPDVVVMDLGLPGGSGIDLVRRLRLAGSRAFVVVLTNHSSEPYRQACLAAGADAFLDKSTEYDRLIQLVERLAAEARTDTEAGDDDGGERGPA